MAEQEPFQMIRHIRPSLPCSSQQAYSANGWERYADADVGINMSSFRKSLPPKQVHAYFEFHGDQIPPKVSGLLKRWNSGEGREKVRELWLGRPG